ncbi:MAG: hypothetical protein CMD16_00615 [Flavobacteriales bacterium]|nr:hypothetical protein [Flavobacteriales bacterium]|tara:strand:+ start:33707 stop:34528 length:822 start_codon:yes stop_codon:yes gene_type:complete
MFRDTLKKMDTELNDVVNYTLDINGKVHLMNNYIGKKVKIDWSGVVVCSCGKKMDSFYRNSGYCYKCYWESPLASQSIFKPELCTAHLGIEERDLAWEKEFQIAPHYVYLANSSGIKVGITRGSQGVVRWMDQGASQAILLAEVPNRRFSGDIEVVLKRFVADVTNWRKMLSGIPESVDLVKMKEELSLHVPEELKKYILPDNTVTEIKYPVNQYPNKIKSVKLDKFPVIEGVLLGIKGQYLLLDDDRVFNVRSHEGFISDFSVSEITQGTLF